jgi:hypothetical protein
MVEMSLPEARLFRVLTGFFGADRVVWSMSVRAVCGAGLVQAVADGEGSWYDSHRCLFTVVDDDDNPKMVMEFSPDFDAFIEVEQLERQSKLPALLGACGVQYVTISTAELDEIIDPRGALDLFSFLKDRFLPQPGTGAGDGDGVGGDDDEAG